ncbi:12752_t:CDS:1, partial [Acaulospora morrowiae]
ELSRHFHDIKNRKLHYQIIRSFAMFQERFRVKAPLKISKLILNEKQKAQLNNLFKYMNLEFESKTWGETDEEQEAAKKYLSDRRLTTDYAESRWKTRWSDTKNGATLYQCSCGSDMETARKTEATKRRKLRQAYEFNGCLAFVR